jgi:hypothetical protein
VCVAYFERAGEPLPLELIGVDMPVGQNAAC